jgi:hypothetical protein
MSPGMVFDTTNNVAVLFGGYGNEVTHSDTWIFDYSTTTWTEMSPTTHPSGRYGPCMFYDAENERTMLFSGNALDGMNPDMWEYNYTTDEWNEIVEYPQPLGRKWGSMTYDSDNQVGLLFGGDCNDPEFVDDTWVFNCSTNEWQEMAPEASPCVRASPGLTYDPINQKAILFGGQSRDDSGYISLDDTWTYDLATGTWTDMSTVSGTTATTTSSTTTTTTDSGIPIEMLTLGITLPVVAVVIVLFWRRRAL